MNWRTDFASLLLEWIVKHKVNLANTLCKNWEPTGAKTNKLDFWQQDETQLQKWKIIDYIAVPIEWMTRSTVARKRAQNLTDDWPVMTLCKDTVYEGKLES